MKLATLAALLAVIITTTSALRISKEDAAARAADLQMNPEKAVLPDLSATEDWWGYWGRPIPKASNPSEENQAN